ncbi:MAG: hypothetical protein KJN65_03750 [Croceitalea sp.]|nr:hypothetical protein [Croceitalea sp.]
MKLKKFIYIISLFLALAIVGCSSSSSSDDSPPPPPSGGTDDEPVVIPDPSATTLVFPENDTECNTGVVNVNNENESTITFEWNASANTTSYSVTVTNLNTNTSTFANSTTTEADITLERGAPYSWSVTSRNQGNTTTAESATFRFYNEGPGIENYAPFPAEAVSPSRGANIAATATVELAWSGSDVDDDIVSYEVFFGTDAATTTSIGVTAEEALPNVEVTSGIIYYWLVITTDSAGNTSTSEVFEFRVN